MSATLIIGILVLIFLTGFLITSVINAVKERDQNRPYRNIQNFSQRATKDIDQATQRMIDKANELRNRKD